MADHGPLAVVTGAAGALGSAVYRELAARGHRIAAVDVTEERLHALTNELGESAVPVVIDASGWRPVLATIQDHGAPTGAVLCAGGWAGGTAVADESGDATFRRMFDLNLETARAALAALVPVMARSGRGSIVVVGSRAVERPHESAGAAAYAASKSAVVSYAQAIAAETLALGVRINAVLPSIIDTPQNRAAMPKADPTKWVAPERLGKVVAFLLSDDATDISGAAIPVYGRI